MQPNKWILPELNKEDLLKLTQNNNISQVVARVLLSRGFNSQKTISEFLFPNKEDLFNPFLLDDCYKAVVRIKEAVEKQEQILIYADRDVDGITSLVILFNTIKTLGGIVSWYIPSDEGYGISKDILDKYNKTGIKLVISVDCGISSVDEVEYANNLGMQVIITDHHAPPEILPNAYAIVDPKKPSCNYPFKELAGCGVSFKVSQALMQTYGKNFDKNIFIISLRENNGTYNIFMIKIRNGMVIEEKELSQVKKDIKILFSYIGDCQIIINQDNLLFDDVENKIIKIEILNTDISLKEEAFLLFSQYRKNELSQDRRMSGFYDENIDLVALGTIADIVPLVSENRILVKTGLDIINQNPSKRYGLFFIIDEYIKNTGNISAKLISWNITPVLNAAGRMAKAEISAKLLLAEDKYKAEDIFVELKKLNNDRKHLQLENIKHFEKILHQQCDIENDKILVVTADGLSHGVTGIVASQFVKLYSKPTILLISDGTYAVGACRSIEGFDIVNALEKTKDLLVKYGGHCQAAGFTIEISKIDEFRKRLKDISESFISTEMVAKKINIDCELKITDINKKTYADLNLLEPFGSANSTPVFLMKNVEFTEISNIGQTGEHLKLKVLQNGTSVNALFWHGVKYEDMLEYKGKFDIVFNLEMNRDNLQLSIVDINNI
ncbi:single-stranded-DNA-specific exonuclease RecJ [Elusimicrobiota bacterium]